MRGQKQAADKQLGITNAVAGTENTNQQNLENTLIPGYTSMMNTGFNDPELARKNQSLSDTGYLSPEDKAAATTLRMGTATQPFESMGFEAANRAGRTRNASDLTAQQDQLALEQGRTAGQAAAGMQEDQQAAQERALAAKQSGEQAGLYGLGGLRGEDLQAMESMYGMAPSTLGARAAGGGWSTGFADVGKTLTGAYSAYKG